MLSTYVTQANVTRVFTIHWLNESSHTDFKSDGVFFGGIHSLYAPIQDRISLFSTDDNLMGFLWLQSYLFSCRKKAIISTWSMIENTFSTPPNCSSVPHTPYADNRGHYQPTFGSISLLCGQYTQFSHSKCQRDPQTGCPAPFRGPCLWYMLNGSGQWLPTLYLVSSAQTSLLIGSKLEMLSGDIYPGDLLSAGCKVCRMWQVRIKQKDLCPLTFIPIQQPDCVGIKYWATGYVNRELYL